MCQRPPFSAIAAIFLLAGCSGLAGDDDAPPGSQTYTYTAYDSTGARIVQGALLIDFREADPEGDLHFLLEGTWDLEQVGEAERIGRQVGEGTLRGSVEADGTVRINLNPGTADDNVTLRGTPEGGPFEAFAGEWTYGGWGVYNDGAFQAESR